MVPSKPAELICQADPFRGLPLIQKESVREIAGGQVVESIDDIRETEPHRCILQLSLAALTSVELPAFVQEAARCVGRLLWSSG
jgi:hypothetical protein